MARREELLAAFPGVLNHDGVDHSLGGIPGPAGSNQLVLCLFGVTVSDLLPEANLHGKATQKRERVGGGGCTGWAAWVGLGCIHGYLHAKVPEALITIITIYGRI